MNVLFELLFNAWCAPYDPRQVPEHLRGDPVKAYGQYAFQEGFRLKENRIKIKKRQAPFGVSVSCLSGQNGVTDTRSGRCRGCISAGIPPQTNRWNDGRRHLRRVVPAG